MTDPDPVTIALRCAQSLLLETPVKVERRSRVWVASMRPIPHHPTGWHRELWPPVASGWVVPMSCVFGTVIEFGADIATGRRRDRRPIRWYGVALAHETEWLVAHGDYRHPADAHGQATAWLATAGAYAISLHAPTEPVEKRSLRPRLDGR